MLTETGYITASGTTTDSSSTFDVTIDKNAFVPGKYYTMNTGKDSGVLFMSLTLMIDREGVTQPITYTSTNAPVTFVVDGTVVSATCTVGLTGLGVEVDESIYPQIEVGEEATEYVAATYSTFVYDGSTKPIFTDTINCIWSNDDDVSDMFVIFTVLGSDNDGDLIDYPLDS